MEASGRHVVLVVDDERHNTELVRRALLPRRDCIVETAGNGEEALAMLERRPVAVLVVDFAMPGMTGVEMLKRARAAGTEVPAILSTAYPDEAEVARAVREGLARAVVAKPWAAHELLAAISTALTSR